jgi:hypothetical protein
MVLLRRPQAATATRLKQVLARLDRRKKLSIAADALGRLGSRQKQTIGKPFEVRQEAQDEIRVAPALRDHFNGRRLPIEIVKTRQGDQMPIDGVRMLEALERLIGDLLVSIGIGR